MTAPLYDWDGTLAPQLEGNSKEYRRKLKTLTPADLNPIAKNVGKVDIATARPEIFHSAIRAAAKRMGLQVGDIHAAGFDKTDTVKKLNRPLIDNNAEVVAKIHANLGEDMATQVPTHTRAMKKEADSWLQRWLSMFAARDAAHQADPTRDAITAKLTGGPIGMATGLTEAVNNQAMGDTPAERRDTMHAAVDDVKDDTYGGAFMRGLKSSPSYVLAGAAAGAGIPAITAAAKGEGQSAARIGTGAGAGAATGLSLALLRPLLQKVILDRTSAKSQRKAIAMKAEHPILTALPFGDMVGAAKAAARGEKLVGGEADGVPASKLPAKALAEGAEHEKEHTKDPKIQKEIASDHLVEDPAYYEKLKKIES
jgi:hypothetical protein